MRRLFPQRAALAFAILLLSACAIFNGPRTVLVPTEQLQAALDKRFPLDMRYLELFDLHATQPKLQLDAQSGRIVLTMDVVLAPPFVKRTWKGSIALSGVVRPDDTQRALVVREPRLDAFHIDGFDPEMSRQITRYGGLFAEQLLQDVPIARYDDVRPPYAGADWVPTKIEPRDDGLMISFEPVR
ncbi:MAG TPA: DUF1439 domain-containing protein [Oxalicibacterium sp.]|jgi:hypothetical protein|nr:DUF1439 domain-containing protein [Oxalicibacterium sp.]